MCPDGDSCQVTEERGECIYRRNHFHTHHCHNSSTDVRSRTSENTSQVQVHLIHWNMPPLVIRDCIGCMVLHIMR